MALDRSFDGRRDADEAGLVEHEVDAVHHIGDDRGVTEVAADERGVVGDVLLAAVREIVENAHLVFGNEGVRDVTADEPRAASDEDRLAAKGRRLVV